MVLSGEWALGYVPFGQEWRTAYVIQYLLHSVVGERGTCNGHQYEDPGGES